MKSGGNIFMVGPMGAGKSTIGRCLADQLGIDFVDSDHVIQERTGVDIPTIFEFEGEQGFRKREVAVIDELTHGKGIVLATGGGAVLASENRNALAGRGVVVYLHCTPEQQYRRTARDRNRPLLQTDDPLLVLQDLMKIRDPLYREIADLVVTTDRKNTQAVAKIIVQWLQEQNLAD